MVKKIDWLVKPLPKQRRNINYENFFSYDNGLKLLNGFKPSDMDDKWLVYSEDRWVYFVRSWTGYHIFGIKLQCVLKGIIIIESWVNNDPHEFNFSVEENYINLIDGLIKRIIDEDKE